MNIGVSTTIRIIDDIINFLVNQKGFQPEKQSPDKIFNNLLPYLNAVTNFVGSRNTEELKKLRGFLGGGAVDKVLREFQYAINQSFEEFNPEGLEKWIKDNSGMYNNPSKLLGDEIQLEIRDFVFRKLKEEYGERNWWTHGINKKIQMYCATAQIEEGHKEEADHYLLTLHYQQIVKDNKSFLLEYFTKDEMKSASIDKRISWFVKLNSIRKKFSHPERDKVTEEEYDFLQELKEWLFEKIRN